MLRAVTFHQEIRTGSSLPLVVGASDGRRYVLKARGGGDGVIASAVDWLALGLGRRLGIPVVTPHAVLVSPGLEATAGDPEIRELIAKSHGVNLATRLVDGARPPSAADLARLDAGTRRDVFLFDLWLLNVDRHEKNPNAVVGDGGFRCLDFSAAMALRALLADTRYDEARLLEQIRRNPLYTPGIDPEPFVERLRGVSESELGELVASLPGEWLEAVSPGLAGRLHALIDEAGVLRRHLEALSSLHLETDEDRRRRSLANKAEFERRFGKL